MKTTVFLSLLGLALTVPRAALAQGTYDPPPGGVPTAPMPEGLQPYQVLPAAGPAPALNPTQPVPQGVQDPYAVDGDRDDEDDGYDVQTDVYYDNANAQGYDDGYDPQAYTQFESELSPYGSWVDMPGYGRVWVPSESAVGSDFYPYGSGGHWADSEYGWTWLSDWSWGWAPFHYGRWLNAGGYGWCWVPGSIWGPAWVNWRAGGGYAGWAPMAPRGITVGPPGALHSPWRFVVASQLGAPHLSFVPSQVVPTIFPHTSAIAAARMTTVNGKSIRINAGPAFGSAYGRVALASAAPRALPRASIVPRAGVPLAARPYTRPGALQPMAPMAPHRSIPIGGPRPMQVAPRPWSSSLAPRPMYRPYAAPYAARPYATPYGTRPYATPYGARPVGPQPFAARPYFAPARPAPYFSRTGYAAPHFAPQAFPSRAYAAPHYSSPSFSAPHYSAPSFSSHSFAPSQSFSHPSFSSGSHGGFSGGHGGGRR